MSSSAVTTCPFTLGNILILFTQLAIAAVVLFVVFKPKLAYILFKTFPRDILGFIRVLKFATFLAVIQLKKQSVGAVFDDTAKKYPNKICFYFEDQQWTFKQVQELTNKVANYFASEGLVKGDTVALLMENRVEYIATWLGLSKIGVVPSFINTNLKGHQLQHSLQAVPCKAVIYGKELSSSLESVLNNDKYISGLSLYCNGDGTSGTGKLLPNSIDLDSELKNVSSEKPQITTPVLFMDKLCYIFTSGTTGLPKAAVINHSRFSMIATLSHFIQGINDKDVIYTTMPLYHTAAGIVGIGHVVLFGNVLVLRKKFSSSNFWRDCKRHNVTVAQYIGELCRYLLALPEGLDDKDHKVRLMIGNGLRGDIWKQFMNRFGIKAISEFYGSTEGNCNMVNITGEIGAVGFVPRWLYPYFFMQLVKVDKDGEPIRDPKTGLLICCKPNEPGELISTISPGHPFRDFQGYADANSKEKKIIRDCFKKGDSSFRSGDILIMDNYGYFYFKDRSGDTFRWKGENVSTAEVESVISRICGLNDAAVYGVQIPRQDGRAGMVAIADPKGVLDLEFLASEVTKQLPAYSRPLFVRVVKQIDMTGTHKMKKVDLQIEGFDISKIKDDVYFLAGGQYLRMDDSIYQDIMSGKCRL